ncbi:MAG: FMN-binding protein [Calditrichaeota bacterium]|nr:MAG: FMN-binding protein [Calditrichota bacterium]
MRTSFLLLICLPVWLNAGIRESAENLICAFYPEPVHIILKKIPLYNPPRIRAERKAGQRFFKKWLYVWRISRQDSTLGYAVLDNVKGKAMPITILAVLDTSGVIRQASIVKYRETVGGAVQNGNWLAGFIGRDKSSSYKIGREIDAISGATISVRSVTRGMYKLTLIFPYIKDIFDAT